MKFTSLTYDGKIVEDVYEAETVLNSFNVSQLMKACNKGDLNTLQHPIAPGHEYDFLSTLFEEVLPNHIEVKKASSIETKPFKGLKYVLLDKYKQVNEWQWLKNE